MGLHQKFMNIPKIFKDRYAIMPFLASLIIIAIAFLVVFINLGGVQSLLIIHFDSYKGIDFLGNKTDVLNILLFALAIIIINMILARELYFRERFLSYLLSFGSLFFVILILIGIFAIISINV